MPRGWMGSGRLMEEGAFSQDLEGCPGLHVTTWTSHCSPLLHSNIALILSVWQLPQCVITHPSSLRASTAGIMSAWSPGAYSESDPS